MSREQSESQRLGGAHEPLNIYEIEHVESLLTIFEKYANRLAEQGEYQQPVYSGYTANGLFIDIKSKSGFASPENRQNDFQVVFGDVMTGDIMHDTPTMVEFQPRYASDNRGYKLGANMALELAIDDEGNTCNIELAHTTCTVVRSGVDEVPQRLLPVQTFAADNKFAYLERTKVWRDRFEAMALQRREQELREKVRRRAREKSLWLNRALAMKATRLAVERPILEAPEALTRVDQVVHALAAKVVRTTVHRQPEMKMLDNLTYLDEVIYSEHETAENIDMDRDLVVA
jgi:hypothetical protein